MSNISATLTNKRLQDIHHTCRAPNKYNTLWAGMTGDVHTHLQTGPYSFTRCSLAATPFGGMWHTRVHQQHRTAPTVHHIVFAEIIHIIVRPYIREWIKYT